MANKYSSTGVPQEKGYGKIMQKRMKTLLPQKTEIPASISIQEAEKLKARVRELEAQLEQQSGKADLGTVASIKQADSQLVSHTKKPD